MDLRRGEGDREAQEVKRRELLALAACSSPHAPVDMSKLNRFASAYNDYIEKLKNDVLDLKAWQTVVDEWNRLK